jgi:hypothetical protein
VQRSKIAFSLAFAFAIVLGHSEARAGDAVATRATSERQPQIVAAPAPEDDFVVHRSARGPFVDLTGTASRGLYLKASPEMLNGNLTAEIRQEDKVVLSELLIVPPRVDKASTVVFFAHAGNLLDRLRKDEAATPGSVTVRITRNGSMFVQTSLSAFEAGTSGLRPAPRSLRITSNSQCTDDCDATYSDCIAWCDPRGNECATCWDNYSSCTSSCCYGWTEVGRTKTGGAYTGYLNIFGLYYCKVTSYWLVEQSNDGGCYSNRFVCESDTVTFFYGSSEPDANGCCLYTDPGDISHSDYCGGTSCF